MLVGSARCIKYSVNRVFQLSFLSGAVLHLSKDQRSLLLKPGRLSNLIESPFDFSLNVTSLEGN